MPNPINFSVANAQRAPGTTTVNPFIYPGGYISITATITGLGSGAGSDYENTGNSIAFNISIDPSGGTNFSDFDDFTWQGGAVTIKGVTDPPPVEMVGIAGIPAGANVRIQVTQVGTFTWGMTGVVNP